jgi:hypothetical protein
VMGVKAGEHHGLVKTQTGGLVHRVGVTAGAAEVFWARVTKKAPHWWRRCQRAKSR